MNRLITLSQDLWKDGVEARWVPPLMFEDVEPLAAATAMGALLVPQHGYVGVTSLTEALAAAAVRHGARFKSETGAIRIHPMPAGRVGVETRDASWDADRVILAAGSWSSQITVEGADAIPVRPIRGQLLHLQGPPGAVNRVLWSSAGYLVPWPDGSVLVGATAEDVGFDEGSTDEGVASLRAAAAAMVPSLADAPLTEVRVGLRPRGFDDLPLLGASTVMPGLIYATAHYRNGILLAPLTAMIVGQLVAGRNPDPSVRWVDPARAGRL